MRYIISKFDTRCAVCRGKIAAGESMAYDRSAPRGRRSMHVACVKGQQPATTTAQVTHSGTGNLFRTFDSVDSYLNAASAPITYGNNPSVWENTQAVEGTHWLGVPTHNDVETITRCGWEDGVKKMREVLKYLSAPVPRSLRRKPVHSDFGDTYDIHAALRGQHDTAWTRHVRQNTVARKSVTLIACISARADISPDQMFMRGAAVLAVTDALTQAGYDVQIIGQTWSKRVYNRKYDDAASILIKSFIAPTNLPSLASTLCLAGFFRHWSFRYKTTQQQQTDEGMGSTVYAAHPRILEQWPNAIIAPHNCFTNEEAQTWVTKTLAQFA